MGWPRITQTPADSWFSYIFLIFIIPTMVFVILLGNADTGRIFLYTLASFILTVIVLFKPFVKIEKEREKNWNWKDN